MDRPFIKLLSTPNSGYIFDVNQNELIPVSESSFRFLQVLLSGKKEPRVPITQELLDLKARGYLTEESAVKEIKHGYSDYLGYFLERKLGTITLQVTQNCNFRCKYCIYSEGKNLRQRTHSFKRMNWETAKTAVDFLWAHSVDSPTVNIGFYGGEPLLEYPLIKKVVEYSEERFLGKELTFNITTNGTLLSKEMILFFQEHDIALMISLDGPKEINDQNRVFASGKGTYDTVMEHIQLLTQVAPEYAEKLQISMVVDPENDFDCINSICLKGAALSEFLVQPSLVDRSYDDDSIRFSEEYIWKYEYQRFLATLSYFGRFPENEVSAIVRTSIYEAIEDIPKIENAAGLKPIDAPSGPCIPGQLRLFVDVFGHFFPCERVSENSPSMRIGSLKSGFNLEQSLKILNIGKLTASLCKNCWAFRFCTLCVKRADDGSEYLSAKARSSFCSEVQANTTSKLKVYLMLKELPTYYAEQIRLSSEKGNGSL